VAKDLESVPAVAASVIAERMTGLAALLSLTILGYLLALLSGFSFKAGNFGIYLLLFAASIFLSVFFMVVFAKRLSKQIVPISRLYEKLLLLGSQLHTYKNNKASLIKALLLSFVFHFTMILNIHFIARGMGVSVEIDQLVFIVPLVALISMIPITINGMGLKEAGFILMFQQIGIGIESGLLIAFISRMYAVVGSLVGAGLYLIGSGAERKPTDPGYEILGA
jgi:uncharacterized protein (TIRG00374 family)